VAVVNNNISSPRLCPLLLVVYNSSRRQKVSKTKSFSLFSRNSPKILTYNLFFSDEAQWRTLCPPLQSARLWKVSLGRYTTNYHHHYPLFIFAILM
jgi:hypothetical protein